ncbi:PIH1 domain-containing protein 2 [Galemys pyrenaicus]|uniref:PIH1 domain-containing protein 2 n=1 Tax=Galemys pyrenaicus TaxID=202257 RepID=A0A8J6AIL5_GALPY|nr:PIH1 domain-containing protein 2 [Galemys pyrenaicus]
METSSKGLLTQVTQFWNLLDDLAESNPESYEKFIQQQLKEGKHLCAAPEPQLCIQTRILDQVSGKAGSLIEEISSTEIQVEIKRPDYELKIVEDQNAKPLKIELKVELPGVKSVSACDLGVSEDDLLIEVSEKYRLHLNLPESVNTEMTTAKFIKEKATLIVTMPLV